MCGFDFHRQRPVGNYIVDFICCELYLVIELDGYTHMLNQNSTSDLKRERHLTEYGLRVIRFWDDEVHEEIDNVLRVIKHAIIEQQNKFGL